jgi:hypothetical protein
MPRAADSEEPMTKRLAIYNFGIFRELPSSPANQGFRDREPANFAAAEMAPGFVARSGYEGDPGPPSLGRQVNPRFYVERGEGWEASTLSLWQNLESLFSFTYSGIHAEALKHARDWFLEKRWPPYVLWWVEAARLPDWSEAVSRFERLHDMGPAAAAFTFKTPFDEHGAPTAIDRSAVRRLSTE